MRILFIEDDKHTSELISVMLSAHRYAVDVVAEGSAGLELATRWSYDLILLDILLPTFSGIEVCRRLRAQDCQTPILMLTTKDSNEDVVAGLDAGADDYVAKSCDASQLLARVRALLRRGGNSSSPVLTWGLLCLDPALARVTYNQQEIPCRPKEYNLLELFLRHPQRIFSRSAIIDHLWSIEETPVEGSVTNLIKDLRQRLKSAGLATDLIETIYGIGYRLKAAPTEAGTPEREDEEIGKENRANVSQPVPAASLTDDWEVRERWGRAAIQHIAERFHVSLEQRIAVLESTERSLQAGKFNLQQREAAVIEAHKLAGGLGTFGYVKASEIAQAAEHLLKGQVNQEMPLANQLAQLLKELRQELAQPPTHRPIANPSVARR